MVEKDKELAKAFTNLKAKTQGLPNKVAFASAEGLLSIKSGIFTRTPEQGRTIRESSIGIQEGRKINPAELIERGFLGDYGLNIEGITNIPLEKPLLVVSNHDNKGVLSSIGQICAVSYAIELARQGGGSSLGENRNRILTSPHWIIAWESDSWLVRHVSVVRKYSRRINEGIARSSEGILVDRNGQREHATSVYSMLGIWRKRGIVAMHPEGKDHHKLLAIDPRAAELIRFIQRLPEKIRPLVIPIAGWTDTKRKTVTVKAGAPITYHGTQDYEEQVMVEIARLLPKVKRGAYTLKT